MRIHDVRCLAVLGPTCSGKSELAVALAKALHGEIISCDSMLVYRGMDIGTAKPSIEARSQVRHHLIDILDLHERYSVHDFLVRSRGILRRLQDEGRCAVVVGGTGLFAKALLYGFNLAPADPKFAATLGPEALAQVQSAFLRAGEIPASWTLASASQGESVHRRLVREAEVVGLTGRTRSFLHDEVPPIRMAGAVQFVVSPCDVVLRKRISGRIRSMLNSGWFREVRTLMDQGFLNSPTAWQALGYREVAEVLLGRMPGGESLVGRLESRTWDFVRRQRTWFRHQHPGSVVLPIRKDSDYNLLTDSLLRVLNSI